MSNVVDMAGRDAYREPPHNLEVEQALLGAVLVNNEAFDQVAGFLSADHFYEPTHGDIYQAIATLIDGGKVADPLTLKPYFDEHEGLREVGGAAYLARLAGAAASIINAANYGHSIVDLARRRSLIDIGQRMVAEAYDAPVDHSALDQIETAQAALGEAAAGAGSEVTARSLGDSVGDVLAAHDRRARGEDDGSILPTGLPSLDGIIGGIRCGELTVMGGRPRMGKTALACAIAYHLAKTERRVCFVSGDMSRISLAARFISMDAAARLGQRVAYKTILSGVLDPIDRDVADKARAYLNDLHIHIDDRGAPSLAHIRQRCRALMRRWGGLDLLIVDHIGKVRPPDARRGKVEQTGEVTGALMALARDLDIGLLALSQLNRNLEIRDKKRPTMADLRWAGEVEQDARTILLVHRPWEYEKDNEPLRSKFKTDAAYSEAVADYEHERIAKEDLFETIVDKQNNGGTGVAALRCDLPVNLISER